MWLGGVGTGVTGNTVSGVGVRDSVVVGVNGVHVRCGLDHDDVDGCSRNNCWTSARPESRTTRGRLLTFVQMTATE